MSIDDFLLDFLLFSIDVTRRNHKKANWTGGRTDGQDRQISCT